MIEDEQQLRYSISVLARNYRLADTTAAQSVGAADVREQEIDGVESMVRHIERQVAAYPAVKYGFAAISHARTETPLPKAA